jgi:hypothetical protein
MANCAAAGSAGVRTMAAPYARGAFRGPFCPSPYAFGFQPHTLSICMVPMLLSAGFLMALCIFSYEFWFEKAQGSVSKIWSMHGIVWVDNKYAPFRSLLFMQVDIYLYKFLFPSVFVNLKNTLIVTSLIGLHCQAEVLNIEIFVSVQAHGRAIPRLVSLFFRLPVIFFFGRST